jgi:hypothetical protein
LLDIADRLQVSKSSVSLWVRDVPFTPSPRRYGAKRRSNRLRNERLAEIAALDADGLARIGTLSEDAFFVAGVALYAGEGGKTDGEVRFANTDPTMVRFFCAWLRRFFDVEEHRLRVRVYCTWDWILMPRSRIGAPSREYMSSSSGSHIARLPMPPFD